MPLKDREARNAYARAHHAKVMAERPDVREKRAAQQAANYQKRMKEDERFKAKRAADFKKWYAEYGVAYAREKKGYKSWEEHSAEMDAKRATRNAYMKEWGQSEKGQRNRTAQSIKKRCGLSIEDYDAVYDAQEGMCKICLHEAPRYGDGRLVVDHCHVSGKFRALLCGKCNTAIGLLGENPDILVSAIEYLKSLQKE